MTPLTADFFLVYQVRKTWKPRDMVGLDTVLPGLSGLNTFAVSGNTSPVLHRAQM